MVKKLIKILLPKPIYQALWLRNIRNKPDRKYLEGTLLPGFAAMNPSRVLSVGTQPYCSHYGDFFANGCQFWTLEIDPELAKFGSPGRHITASVVDVDQHFDAGSLDVVLLNGIFGWGVDDIENQTKTLRHLRKVMKPGGVLLVGWNDDMMPDQIPQMAEGQGFKRWNPMKLPDRKKFEGFSHTYDLFTAV